MLAPASFRVKNFVSGTKFYARKGAYGLTANIYCGLHEFGEMAFLLHFLRPDDLFFDVGANAGSYTLLAAGACRAKTIAFEPVNETFGYLTKNIRLNGLQNITQLINAAAGEKQGTVTFTSDEDITNHAIPGGEDNHNHIIVNVVPVDSFIADAVPCLIKIDVEGFETEVLKGMENTLGSDSLKAIIIELNGSGARYGFDESKIHELLLSKQFKPYNYDPFHRQLTEQASYGNHNTIYCRDIGFVSHRVHTAAPFSIMGEKI
ncbi:MAG TPA: FkbM family methyltransferase [Mucilaginibacter sp.]